MVDVTLPGGYGMMGTDAYHQIPATDFSNVQSHNSAARSNGYVQPPSYSGAFPASSNMLSGTVGPSDAAYMIHGNHGQAGGAADTLSGTIGPADTGKDFLHIGLMTTRGPPAQGARGVMATRDALDAPAGCTTVAENFGVPGTRPVLNSPCAVQPGYAMDTAIQPCNGLMTMDCVFGVLGGSSRSGQSSEAPNAGQMPRDPWGSQHYPEPSYNPMGAQHQGETTVATVVGLGNEQPMPPLPPNAETLFGPGSRANTAGWRGPNSSGGAQGNAPLCASGGSSAAYTASDEATVTTPVTAPAALPRPGIAPHEAKVRAAWDVGSILEIYSSSAGRWHVSHVTKVERGSGPDVLTMQFYVDDGAKNKALYRTDPQLAPFGTRTWGELPAGMEVKPSQNRPGQFVCFDTRTGVKYESPELAWAWYFDQMQNAASKAATMDTNYSVASSSVHASHSKAPPGHFAPQQQGGVAPLSHCAPQQQHFAPQQQAPPAHCAPQQSRQQAPPAQPMRPPCPPAPCPQPAQSQRAAQASQQQAPTSAGQQMPPRSHAGDQLMTTYAGHMAVAAAARAAAQASMDAAHGKVPLPAF
mmetsp:Transcript_576/g.928  ORF Transcript_576/g.928 Transcript_576/m.928 type:complete len:583 (-) Transcript_576:83-1831(-)